MQSALRIACLLLKSVLCQQMLQTQFYVLTNETNNYEITDIIYNVNVSHLRAGNDLQELLCRILQW